VRRKDLQTVVRSSPFDTAVGIALAEISSSDATRREYRRDFDMWVSFCGEFGLDAKAPLEGSVAAWIEWMKKKSHAPKTRARRISSLSSIYRELRRKKVVPANPFSVDEGPRREKVSVVEPTPLPSLDSVRKIIAACTTDTTPLGLRDAAIVRVLWSTGMRRTSLLSMTFERLQKDRAGYVATVTKKGGKDQRVLICGKAKEALAGWLAVLKDGKMTTGAIWRRRSGQPMVLPELNRVLERRGAGVGEKVSPHMLRVAFLTYNPAGLEAKQEAAGHTDPATTRLYDRSSWKGREAFEQMPEIEDTTE
jgi:site-specific recombinase XerD